MSTAQSIIVAFVHKRASIVTCMVACDEDNASRKLLRLTTFRFDFLPANLSHDFVRKLYANIGCLSIASTREGMSL